MLSFILKIWAVLAAIWFPFLLWIYAGTEPALAFKEAGSATAGIFAFATLLAVGLRN